MSKTATKRLRAQKGSKTAKPNNPRRYDLYQDKRIKALARKVGTPEYKYTDTGIAGGAGSPMTLAGAGLSLNFNAQGDQPFNRSGNQIRCTYLDIRGYITMLNTDVRDRVARLMVFWDKEPSGALPTFSGTTSAGTVAVVDTTSTVGLIPEVFAPRSVETQDRFKIIFDRRIRLIAPPLALEQIAVPFRIRKRLNKITRFKNTTSAQTSIMSNGLIFCWFIDQVGAVAPIMNFNSRVFYTDD